MIAEALLSWEQAVLAFRADPKNRELMLACFYDDPLIKAAERYYASAEWTAVSALLGVHRGRVLDIGAGRGVSSYAFARSGWDVTALEPDPSAVVGAEAIRSLAGSAGLTIEIVEEWGERLPFDDNAFEAVYCRAVLHHARDLGKLCQEMHRVLQPGGLFLATREHVITNSSEIAAFQAEHPLHALYGGEYAYTLDEYRRAITSAGLAIEQQLNPMESDINLYPSSRGETKARWATRLGLPTSRVIPNWLLSLRGSISRTPGRLYTFLARKPR